MGLRRFLQGLFAKRHVRVGLALGSGGAKGAAHVGVIRAFEEEGIKFDIVAGSSIGSVVGAMYALGFSSDEMLAIVKEYALTDVKKLLTYKFRGTTVEQGLDEILGEKNFEDTLLPFCAVAADLNTGEQVNMKHGRLSTALAASSAIPPAFKPVGRLNRRLVDGAFVDAVPADVVKQMGADVVVSVSLSSVAANSVIKTVLDASFKGHGVKEQDRLWQMKEFSDFIISPDLSAFRGTDIDKTDEMYHIGYETARSDMKDIVKLLKSGKVRF